MNKHNEKESAFDKTARMARMFASVWNTGGVPRVRARVSVGKVILPLHGSATGNPGKQLLHHMAMQEMAGLNWQGHPKGFQIAPTSKKNARTHRKGPATRVEGLAKAAGKGAPV